MNEPALAEVWPLSSARETVRLDGRERVVGITVPFISRSVRVTLDGDILGTVQAPTLRAPWATGSWQVARSLVTVALVSQGMRNRFHYAVLVDGRGSGGTELDAIHQLAPAPLSRFEAWTEDWTYFRMSEVARQPLAPPWVRVWAFAAEAAILVAIIIRFEARVLGALLLVFSALSFLALSLRTWRIALARSQQWLARRDDLPDLWRLALLSILFVLILALAFAGAFVPWLGPAYISDQLTNG